MENLWDELKPRLQAFWPYQPTCARMVKHSHDHTPEPFVKTPGEKKKKI